MKNFQIIISNLDGASPIDKQTKRRLNFSGKEKVYIIGTKWSGKIYSKGISGIQNFNGEQAGSWIYVPKSQVKLLIEELLKLL